MQKLRQGAKGAITRQEGPHFISEWVQNSCRICTILIQDFICFNVFPIYYFVYAINLPPNCKRKVPETKARHEYLQPKQRGCWDKQGVDTPDSEVTENKLTMDWRGLSRTCCYLGSYWAAWNQRETRIQLQWHRASFYSISSHLQLSLFEQQKTDDSNLYSDKTLLLFS